MESMMMSPFGGPFGGMGGRGRGGPGGIGGMFAQMDAMMDSMMGGAMMGTPGMDGGQMMSMQSMGGGMGGGDGGFSCQTMMISSGIGPDGQRHTERFSSSTVGDNARRVAETQQAYSNSMSGSDKMSLERQMQDQGRKMVKEYNRFTGEERNTDLFKGMTENQTSQFDTHWRQSAAPYLPQHAVPDMRQLTAAPQSVAPRALQPTFTGTPQLASGTPILSASSASSGYPTAPQARFVYR